MVIKENDLKVIERNDLSFSAKGLYVYLASKIGDNGFVEITQEELCKASKTKEAKTIRKYLKELTEAGVIVTVRQGLTKPNKIYIKK